MRNENVVGALDRKYQAALVVVTVLVLGNQALVQPYLMRLTTDAPLINVAGRQRMLSQRLAKAALVLDRGQGESAKKSLDEMRQVLDLWTASHEQLVRGNTGATPSGRNSLAVREELSALQPHFAAMSSAARSMIGSGKSHAPDPAAVRDGLAAILEHEPEYLRRMDHIVWLYEREARGRIETFRRVGWALTALILAALLAIGLFIFRPAARLIRRQVAELAAARDELEDRVRQRTKELEAARERHRTLLEQLSHVGRTSAVGEMASALAHELNQPLGAIANYAEGCLIALNEPEPALGEVRDALTRLREATMRAGRIIDRVRGFVTRHPPSQQTFEANQVVRDTLEILEPEVHRRGVTVQLEMAHGLPLLWGDPVQIQQVLVNLVRNSLDAIAQSQTPSPSLVIWTRPAEQGTVELGVSDNGEGIPPERLARVFDAYFSTRAGGMGMGLAISRTIVEAHQGRFLVESEPGVRTAFRFQLPPAEYDHERTDSPHRG